MQPMHFVNIPHGKPEIPDSNFTDVLAEEFAEHCDHAAPWLTALGNAPNLIQRKQARQHSGLLDGYGNRYTVQ